MRAPDHPSQDRAVWLHLQTILQSPEFHHSERMRRFLSFIVDETLAGRQAGLKEYTIGTAVFDRGVTFDPAIDPIVRVEARRLRAKLSTFYGRAIGRFPLTIRLPKGGYVPEFSPFPQLAPPATAILTRARFTCLTPGLEFWCETLNGELTCRFACFDAYKAADESKPLDAALLLSGCVQHRGERLRVDAFLIHTGTGECHATYARCVRTSDPTQTLAARIADALNRWVRMQPESRVRSDASASGRGEAQQARPA